MSERRATVDRTELEEWESERNRVAWNLPRVAAPAPSKRPYETAEASRRAPDAADNAANDG